MGRSRPKFSFPLPGRNKSQPNLASSSGNSNTKDKNDHPIDSRIPPIPRQPEWSNRPEEPSSYSKAERVLGTAGMPFRPSRSQSSLPQSPVTPGYMTITVSEASFESDYTDRSAAIDNTGFYPTKRPGMVHRPSSNILGTGNANGYGDDGRRGSNSSSISRRLHAKTSNSTMRSYYDPQSSPLAISQQTSDSAVRDMALRKGYPQVAHGVDSDPHEPLPPAHHLSGHKPSHEMRNENRRSKPARLDLSKLFPKPRASSGQETAIPLLSPTKMVNSPTAMSVVSDYFPRPMTREPTPQPKGHAKLTKAPKRQQKQAPPIQPHIYSPQLQQHPQFQQSPQQQHQRPTSPVRMHQRDTYDNAKINVRRPPRGIQHWFEGFDDESSEEEQDQVGNHQAPAHIATAVGPNTNRAAPVPTKKPSLGRLADPAPNSYWHDSYHQQTTPTSAKDHFVQNHGTNAHRLNSPSQFSVQSQTSTKTKESSFLKSNLQDSSVLSMSSSEDEEEDILRGPNKARMRDSVGSTDDHGEIIIGQAQAFEVRPRNGRRPSDSKMSMRTNSTSAATIEVMYTPEPYSIQQFPRPSYSSRRSSHVRQPSVIPEDEDVRPKTSANRPMSPSTNSVRSARTSVSEPRARNAQHKYMAVTAEEEALLEMMRRKRAAMQKQSFSEGYESARKHDETRQSTPPEEDQHFRTSGFLALDSPSAGPVRVVNTPPRKSRASTTTSSPLLQPPPRGRPTKSNRDSTIGTSMLRDSSSCAPEPNRQLPLLSTSQTSLAHQLGPQPAFSPLDIFPSPAQSPVPTVTDASMASPTTTDHASPLPSPITPGLRNGEADVNVKVASSEPSCSGDHESDDVAILETGVIGPSSYVGMKLEESHGTSHHQRRRTASSGADIPVDPPRNFSKKTPAPSDLSAVSEGGSSRTPSIVEPPIPSVPKRNAKRTSVMSTTSTNNTPRSASSDVYSTHSNSPKLSTHDWRSHRAVSRGSSINSSSMQRDSVAVGSSSTRCSVSEDVLAAWGSLGGGRIGGM